jgi:cytochrome o ubiquinol oxidase operon protein cyoD
MTDRTDELNADDLGPGYTEAADRGIRQGVDGYLIGLVLAALLTVASFYAVYSHLIWGPAIPIALVALAVAQIGVHLVFFLHLTTAPDNTNNVLALAFGVLIVTLIIGGSLWIMDHLNDRMMPMDQTMQMPR